MADRACPNCGDDNMVCVEDEVDDDGMELIIMPCECLTCGAKFNRLRDGAEHVFGNYGDAGDGSDGDAMDHSGDFGDAERENHG